MADYYFSGATDKGYNRAVNEDYVDVVQLQNDLIFAVIADGMGSMPSGLQPANIVCTDMCNAIRDIYNTKPDFLIDNAEWVLKMLVSNCNRVIGAFKKANEEVYSGFGSTLTCCLLDPNHNFTLVHIGNSRLYLIRNKKGTVGIRQLTTDHTVAKDLLDKGTITEEEYYTHPERTTLTSALGFVSEPIIQTLSAPVKEDDILLMTTDGIHYAVRPEPMVDIILKAGNCTDAVNSVIYAAKTQKYVDNMSSIVIFVK